MMTDSPTRAQRILDRLDGIHNPFEYSLAALTDSVIAEAITVYRSPYFHSERDDDRQIGYEHGVLATCIRLGIAAGWADLESGDVDDELASMDAEGPKVAEVASGRLTLLLLDQTLVGGWVDAPVLVEASGEPLMIDNIMPEAFFLGYRTAVNSGENPSVD